ncbi:MAG: sigma 54-interacting transcriptional regulator [Planctomycetota bacterium]
MIFHLLIVDDEEDVLESLIPGFVADVARRLQADPRFRKANGAAGNPLPANGRFHVRVSAHGYRSAKLAKYSHPQPTHLHVHLCCEKGGSFSQASRLLKEQFFAVVVSDLRFSDDLAGSRAGRFFIEDVHRRNPETFGILYSAYQRPDGFPQDRFIRKGSASNLGGEELIAKMVEGFAAYLETPNILRFASELSRRGLVYQSNAFGSTLRRLYDYADLYFGQEKPEGSGRRHPRPTLLLDGETGTGKTELAGLLHQISERRAAPFVSATCNQLRDETFLRSILFGHVKGSFTGATAERAGLVETAGKGILLLDDLHKLSEGASVVLHSFLDDGEYSHIGQDEIRRRSEAAIVCTVESPKWEEIKGEQELAESFIHRVEQLVIRVPPLRSRPEDIEYQATSYCSYYAEQLGVDMELSKGAVAWLVEFGFPGGNSRKLRDFIKGLVAANSRVTDFLDLAEVEEQAFESGLTTRGETSLSVAPDALPSTANASSTPGVPHDGLDAESLRWRARIEKLSTQALVEECGLDPVSAEQACKSLFERDLPIIWSQFRKLVQLPGAGRAIEIKLFDELFRYYAVHSLGNPAKAAKELGMKDNALREFIYSREQKRGGTEK